MSNDSSKVPLPPAPKKVWHPWLGLFVAPNVFLWPQLTAGLAVSIYPALHHWSDKQSNDWLNSNIAAQVGFVILAEFLTLGLLYLFVRMYTDWRQALGLRRPRWSDLGFGLLAVMPYFLLYSLTVGVVSHFVPSLNVNQTQELGFDHVHGLAQLVLTFLCLVILPPIAEEILFRGFLFSNLKRIVPVVYAAIGTSILFAIAHLGEGGSGGPLYIAALDTFVLSMVLVFLREKTGALWSSMTLHAIKNGIAFTALFVLHVR